MREREKVGISRLGAEIVPVFGSHAHRSRFTEAWHSLQSAVKMCGTWAVDGIAGLGLSGRRLVSSYNSMTCSAPLDLAALCAVVCKSDNIRHW